MQYDGVIIDPVYAKFWLWVLGAYEVVRTMCEAEQCFSAGVRDQLRDLKQRLTLLRIPFAKQELPGKKIPVNAEPSPCTMGGSPPDYKFRVKDQMLSVRDSIHQFGAVLSGIKRTDVLAHHRTTYSIGGGRVKANPSDT